MNRGVTFFYEGDPIDTPLDINGEVVKPTHVGKCVEFVKEEEKQIIRVLWTKTEDGSTSLDDVDVHCTDQEWSNMTKGSKKCKKEGCNVKVLMYVYCSKHLPKNLVDRY